MATGVKEFSRNEAVPARGTRVYRAELTGHDGEPVPASAVVSLEATLLDVKGAIVNGRINQNVLNANGGKVEGATQAVFTLLLTSDDTIPATASPHEKRLLILEMTYKDSDDRDGAEPRNVWFYLRGLKQPPEVSP